MNVLKHDSLILKCGKLTRALIAHQIFFFNCALNEKHPKITCQQRWKALYVIAFRLECNEWKNCEIAPNWLMGSSYYHQLLYKVHSLQFDWYTSVEQFNLICLFKHFLPSITINLNVFVLAISPAVYGKSHLQKIIF
jgi:hypothetical protein